MLELLPDVSHHLQHGLLSVLLEVPGHEHLTDGRREAPGRRADASLPPRRRRDLSGGISVKYISFMALLTYGTADGRH